MGTHNLEIPLHVHMIFMYTNMYKFIYAYEKILSKAPPLIHGILVVVLACAAHFKHFTVGGDENSNWKHSTKYALTLFLFSTNRF